MNTSLSSEQSGIWSLLKTPIENRDQWRKEQIATYEVIESELTNPANKFLSTQPFDSLSKQLYDHLIREDIGRVEISLEVPGESLFIDVVVTPNPNPTGNRLSLGLLGRAIQRRCILETYRNAPTAEATNICMFKRTWYFLELRRRATRAKRAFTKSDQPQLWIVTPTASDNYSATRN